jgi:oligopeptide transport system substrate-binding protein
MRPVLVVGILVVGLVAVLVGISPPSEKADFTFINRGTIGTLDPAAMSWMQDLQIALTVWEGLCIYDPKTTDPIPGSAEAPEISSDQRTYTFRIRPDARWSNGDPLTAEDFVYAWRRALEPGTAGDYSVLFDHIQGVRAYVEWRNQEIRRLQGITDPAGQRAACDAHFKEADHRFSETVGITALDEKTLRVRLVRPLPYFLDLCAFSTFLPVHRASLERFKVVDPRGLIYYNEQWTKPYNACYNGPFRLTEWKFKQHLKMVKNPYYWNRDAVKPRTIKEIEVEDANTAWLLYSGGDVDYLSYIDTVYAPKLIAASSSPLDIAINKTGRQRHDIHAFRGLGTYFFNFNCKSSLPDGRPNPFYDRRVRQAFTMALDKRSIVDQVVRLGNDPATAFIPPGMLKGYPEVKGLAYDPPRARELMAEAGYPGGIGFPEVVALYNTGALHGEICQATVNMWEQNLGVHGRIEGKETKTFLEDKKTVNYVVCRAAWFGDYRDPTTFLDIFQSDNGNNDSGYMDPKYDRMLREADLDPDPQRRLARLADTERYLVNESLPLLPVFYYVQVVAFDPDRVKNLYLDPRLLTALYVIEVVK